MRYYISKHPKSRKEKYDYPLNWERIIEAQKAACRWMVEYPYYIVKRIFGCNRAIYRGIKKNGCQMDMAFASANLYMFRLGCCEAPHNPRGEHAYLSPNGDKQGKTGAIL